MRVIETFFGTYINLDSIAMISNAYLQHDDARLNKEGEYYVSFDITFTIEPLQNFHYQKELAHDEYMYKSELDKTGEFPFSGTYLKYIDPVTLNISWKHWLKVDADDYKNVSAVINLQKQVNDLITQWKTVK